MFRQPTKLNLLTFLKACLSQGFANKKMTHSGWISTTSKLTQAKVKGITDGTCQAKLDYLDQLGFYQMCAVQVGNETLAKSGGRIHRLHLSFINRLNFTVRVMKLVWSKFRLHDWPRPRSSVGRASERSQSGVTLPY